MMHAPGIGTPPLPVRVVIAEDEKIIALDMQRELERSGFDVVGTATTAREAMEQAGLLRPHVILMDIILGGGSDGIAAAKEIRETYDIPVLFLSARVDENTVRRAAAADPYGYILKPFVMNEIIIAIKMIIHRHFMEKKFREDSNWLTTILSSIADAIIATDHLGKINFLNDAARTLTGWRDENVMGESIEGILALKQAETNEPYPDPVSTLMRDPGSVVTITEAVLSKPNGDGLPVDCRAAAIRDAEGGVDGAVLIMRDVTDRIQADRWTRYLAFHDILTGLPNRAWLYNQLRSIILPNGASADTRVGIMFLDLDDFKRINDCFGHEVGDDLLQQVAERLKRSVRRADIVGRLAGDEFIVILDRVAEARDVEKVARNITREFQKPFWIGGCERDVTMSIGIAIYPDDSENLERLIKYADSAMYQAKQRGKNAYTFFSDLSEADATGP